LRDNTRRDDAANTLSREFAREERARAQRRRTGIAAAVLLAMAVTIAVGLMLVGRKPGRTAVASAAPLAAVIAGSRTVKSETTKPAGEVPALPPSKAASPAPVRAKTPPVAVVKAARPKQARSAQDVAIGIGTKGYEPSSVVVRAGVPIVLTVGRGQGCAAGFELPALGIHLDNSAGPATARLGALKPGTYKFTCSMGMVSGRLEVR